MRKKEKKIPGEAKGTNERTDGRGIEEGRTKRTRIGRDGTGRDGTGRDGTGRDGIGQEGGVRWL